MSKIVIHIDSLVLDGVDRVDGPLFQEALQQALREKIAAQGLPAHWQASPNQTVQTIQGIQAPPSAGEPSAEALAQQTANLIYGGQA